MLISGKKCILGAKKKIKHLKTLQYSKSTGSKQNVFIKHAVGVSYRKSLWAQMHRDKNNEFS